MLSNPSRLLERNREELASLVAQSQNDQLLLVLPPADGFIDNACQQFASAKISVLTNQFAVRDLALRALPESQVHYTHDLEQLSGPFGLIVLYLQKSRPFTTALVDQLCPLLAPEGRIVLVGENGEGIKSWRKHLSSWGEAESIASGCHSGLLELCPDAAARSSNKPWAEQSFDIEVAGTSVAIKSLPGVFSHGRLDIGTRLLLETLSQENIRGQVLDFGCGAGVIGSWLANRHGRCRPTLLDTDAMALESSRRTLLANNIDGKVVASHGLKAVTGRYDWIISNPPFHDGVKTRYDVTESFLAEAKAHLVRGGQLRIVANNFLRYQPLIEEAFGHCEVLAQKHGFTIYGATLANNFVSAKLDRAE